MNAARHTAMPRGLRAQLKLSTRVQKTPAEVCKFFTRSFRFIHLIGPTYIFNIFWSTVVP